MALSCSENEALPKAIHQQEQPRSKLQAMNRKLFEANLVKFDENRSPNMAAPKTTIDYNYLDAKNYETIPAPRTTVAQPEQLQVLSKKLIHSNQLNLSGQISQKKARKITINVNDEARTNSLTNIGPQPDRKTPLQVPKKKGP